MLASDFDVSLNFFEALSVQSVNLVRFALAPSRGGVSEQCDESMTTIGRAEQKHGLGHGTNRAHSASSNYPFKLVTPTLSQRNRWSHRIGTFITTETFRQS